jgi:hypothetical protein
MHRAVYIYCVVRSARKPAAATVPSGLPGAERPAPVKLDDRLWMVTASVPLERYGSGPLEEALRDLDWVASSALAHEAVVEHFARVPGAAVIPMTLFTMFSTDARAAAEMRKRRPQLERVFDRIEGCEEWGIRVLRDTAASPRRDESGPVSGTAFLAARKQARDASREAAATAATAADQAFDSLAGIARESRRRTDGTAGGVASLLDAAFLVPTRQRSRFRTAAKRLARGVAARGAAMTLTGPWPPYSFVAGKRAS